MLSSKDYSHSLTAKVKSSTYSHTLNHSLSLSSFRMSYCDGDVNGSDYVVEEPDISRDFS